MRRTSRGPVWRNPVAEWTAQLLGLLLLTAMVAQPYVIPSGSMSETLLTGDHVIVDKMVYAPAGPIGRRLLPYQSVERGDIVVLRSPIDLSQNLVKRVIGVPGDLIRIVEKQLWLNGRPVSEPYKVHATSYLEPSRDNFPSLSAVSHERGRRMLRDYVINGDLSVPDGHYFVLGDNRDDSFDSRYWGLVHRENIFGKPLLVYWSYDAETERLMDGNLNPEHLLDIAFNFFRKTRWERTFQLIRGYPLE